MKYLKTFEGLFSLTIAVDRGNFDEVRRLIENNYNINQLDVHGNSSLIISISKNYKEIVDYLLENNIDVNLTNVSNRTALFYASVRFDIKMIEKLTDYGANWNIQDDVGFYFDDYLNNDDDRDDFDYKDYLYKKYPEQYEMMLLAKDAKKYNL
jgi:hypothetical protein